MEEEVVLDAHVGDDGHCYLDVAALVGGGEDVEGGQAEAEDGSDDGVEGQLEWCLGWDGRDVGMGGSRRAFARCTHLRIEIWGTRIWGALVVRGSAWKAV